MPDASADAMADISIRLFLYIHASSCRFSLYISTYWPACVLARYFIPSQKQPRTHFQGSIPATSSPAPFMYFFEFSFIITTYEHLRRWLKMHVRIARWLREITMIDLKFDATLSISPIMAHYTAKNHRRVCWPLQIYRGLFAHAAAVTCIAALRYALFKMTGMDNGHAANTDRSRRYWLADDIFWSWKRAA